MPPLNSNPHSDRAAREPFAPSRVLTGSLYVVVAAVLTQAILAGLFISATAEARLAHLIVGSLLPWFAIIPAVSAFRRRRDIEQRVGPARFSSQWLSGCRRPSVTCRSR